MKKILRDGVFTFTQNRCFEEVVRHCGQTQRKGQEGTWISPEMLAAYVALHAAGHAHSYEVWLGQDLVGGFYGVAVGEVFCGESMFSSVSNASKAGFIHFVEGSQYRLIDCQVWSAHLESLGAVLVPKKEFLSYLQPCETI